MEIKRFETKIKKRKQKNKLFFKERNVKENHEDKKEKQLYEM